MRTPCSLRRAQGCQSPPLVPAARPSPPEPSSTRESPKQRTAHTISLAFEAGATQAQAARHFRAVHARAACTCWGATCCGCEHLAPLAPHEPLLAAIAAGYKELAMACVRHACKHAWLCNMHARARRCRGGACTHAKARLHSCTWRTLHAPPWSAPHRTTSSVAAGSASAKAHSCTDSKPAGVRACHER